MKYLVIPLILFLWTIFCEDDFLPVPQIATFPNAINQDIELLAKYEKKNFTLGENEKEVWIELSRNLLPFIITNDKFNATWVNEAFMKFTPPFQNQIIPTIKKTSQDSYLTLTEIFNNFKYQNQFESLNLSENKSNSRISSKKEIKPLFPNTKKFDEVKKYFENRLQELKDNKAQISLLLPGADAKTYEQEVKDLHLSVEILNKVSNPQENRNTACNNNIDKFINNDETMYSLYNTVLYLGLSHCPGYLSRDTKYERENWQWLCEPFNREFAKASQRLSSLTDQRNKLDEKSKNLRSIVQTFSQNQPNEEKVKLSSIINALNLDRNKRNPNNIASSSSNDIETNPFQNEAKAPIDILYESLKTLKELNNNEIAKDDILAQVELSFQKFPTFIRDKIAELVIAGKPRSEIEKVLENYQKESFNVAMKITDIISKDIVEQGLSSQFPEAKFQGPEFKDLPMGYIKDIWRSYKEIRAYELANYWYAKNPNATWADTVKSGLSNITTEENLKDQLFSLKLKTLHSQIYNNHYNFQYLMRLKNEALSFEPSQIDKNLDIIVAQRKQIIKEFNEQTKDFNLTPEQKAQFTKELDAAIADASNELKVQYEKSMEEQRKKGNYGSVAWYDNLWINLKKAAEATVDLTAGNVVNLASVLARGDVEWTADFLDGTRKFFNKGEGGSILGSDKELVNSSLGGLYLSMNPLQHAAGAFNSLLDGIDDAYVYTARKEMDLSKEEYYNQLTGKGNYGLKSAYYSFKTAKAALALAAMLYSGTGGAALRNPATLRAMFTPAITKAELSIASKQILTATAFSLPSAVGSELIASSRENRKINYGDIAKNTAVGAGDCLTFMGALNVMNNKYFSFLQNKAYQNAIKAGSDPVKALEAAQRTFMQEQQAFNILIGQAGLSGQTESIVKAFADKKPTKEKVGAILDILGSLYMLGGSDVLAKTNEKIKGAVNNAIYQRQIRLSEKQRLALIGHYEGELEYLISQAEAAFAKQAKEPGSSLLIELTTDEHGKTHVNSEVLRSKPKTDDSKPVIPAP